MTTKSKKTTTAIARQEGGASLLQRVGNRYGLDPNRVYEALLKTAFKEAKSQEQVIALLVVADQYKLNPFTREIYAFPDKGGGVVPIVSIDGWLRIMNDHPQFDGMEFVEAEERIVVGQSKPAPEWMECIIHRKDRAHPTIAREYLEEVYRNTPPWNQTTARMLRHRCIMQAARIAFGFGGIVDPEDAERAAEFDFEGVVLEEAIVAAVIGKAGYKKLLKQAHQCGYTEADVLATAATAGYEGPGDGMPEETAQRISEGMQAQPKEPEPPTADPETGEIEDAPSGAETTTNGAYRTPLMGDE